jgi:SAM-dependent methyltransferase
MSVEMTTSAHDAPASVAAVASQRAYWELFLISFGILFFELSCIRWFSSMVVFLTFFTNIVLMACFLGMSVGCLTASRKQNLITWVIPLLLSATVLACAVLYVYHRFGRIMIDVGGQGSPQQIYFGTEFRPRDPSKFIVPIELVAGVFFVLIALMFVGQGQIMGRAFDRISNRVAAYTANILGSLAGILAFGLASYFRTPPYLWMAVSVAIFLYFLPRWTPLQIHAQIVLIVLVAFASYYGGMLGKVFWSPYYKVLYNFRYYGIITNNIVHQTMVPIREQAPAYSLPYLLNRDAGGKPFDDVTVIGAGSGNDVSAALWHQAKHVDAVEIDPVISELGQLDHPDHPYDDPRVTLHLDDGRSFTKKTDSAYDLASYAVVDSVVLHSGYSNLRLESFLFTEEAFQDIKAKLKPGGVFAMYNWYRQGWVVGRLAQMAEKVFGTKPLVICLPYLEKVGTGRNGGFTLLLVGNTKSEAVDRIRKALDEKKYFWLNEKPSRSEGVEGYGPEPPMVAGVPPESWQKIGAAEVETTGIGPLPTDDWPFLYLHEPTVPGVNLRGILMIAALSLVVLFAFAPVRTIRPNGQMFFLGAGFMLLEAKGVVHMALLFGSTWVVNSIVFCAILIMILLSNLFVLAFPPRRPWLFYGLLIAALLVNIFVPMTYFLGLPGVWKTFVSCAVIFVPVFFAGVIFAAAFRDSRQPDVDFGSNIGGVILGGLSENLSLVLGFNHLLLVAIGFYLLSALLKPRLAVAAARG